MQGQTFPHFAIWICFMALSFRLLNTIKVGFEYLINTNIKNYHLLNFNYSKTTGVYIKFDPSTFSKIYGPLKYLDRIGSKCNTFYRCTNLNLKSQKSTLMSLSVRSSWFRYKIGKYLLPNHDYAEFQAKMERSPYHTDHLLPGKRLVNFNYEETAR